MGNCGSSKKKPMIFESPKSSEYKCILMGPKRSGKTTFFMSFMNDPVKKFSNEDLNTNYDDIIGKNFFSYTFILNPEINPNKKYQESLKKIKINLWDLAGDMDLHIKNITKNMIHFTDGIFLLFDLTNEASFDELVNEWWPMLESVINLSEIKGKESKFTLYHLLHIIKIFSV
jgi:GTPase SAR1 family protein